MTPPNHRLKSKQRQGHTISTSMSSICMTYRCTSPLRIIIQVVNCHLCGMFPLLLESYTQLVIFRQKWMSATNCLMKDVQDVYFWRYIREYAAQSSTRAFSSSRNSLLTRAKWGFSLSCRKMVLFWQTKSRMIKRSISSRYLTAFSLPRVTWSFVHRLLDIPAQTSMPPPLCATLHIYGDDVSIKH